MILRFGKYRGFHIREVPEDYLQWLSGSSAAMVAAIEQELGRRVMEGDGGSGWLNRVVSAGYRELAKQVHPDAGGSTQDMQELNAAVTQLRQMVQRT